MKLTPDICFYCQDKGSCNNDPMCPAKQQYIPTEIPKPTINNSYQNCMYCHGTGYYTFQGQTLKCPIHNS